MGERSSGVAGGGGAGGTGTVLVFEGFVETERLLGRNAIVGSFQFLGIRAV